MRFENKMNWEVKIPEHRGLRCMRYAKLRFNYTKSNDVNTLLGYI